jgi:hypothetical protein
MFEVAFCSDVNDSKWYGNGVRKIEAEEEECGGQRGL